MTTFIDAMKMENDYIYTENGAIAHSSTGTKLLDLFGMGAAYRTRSEADCILLFKEAFAESPIYALKCLFYLRDVRGGQGERRFFRVCMRWLANEKPNDARRNMQYIPMYGRWDDLYIFVGTELEKDAFDFMKEQLALDVQCNTPSLLAKWLKSENASSKETKTLAFKTREAFGLTAKQYRKILSIMRQRINILERLMSEGRWDEIEFDKIPSKAGLKYKNAFARHDVERMKSEKNVQSYADFAKDTTKKVNAKTLYPYEAVKEAIKHMNYSANRTNLNDTNRLMINKYWDNLEDYFKGASLNALCMVDTSGSMTWHEHNGAKPIDVATSIGLYCAEKAKGPFANHYISFSSKPQLIECKGVDFCDKVYRIANANLCENTNIETAFDMILRTAIQNHVPQEDMPQNIIVISDMEFDRARDYHYGNNTSTLMEGIAQKWKAYGYTMPHLIYWNVDAKSENIPMLGKGAISYVSGFSPSIFQTIMTAKTGFDLMMECLNQTRYAVIK